MSLELRKRKKEGMRKKSCAFDILKEGNRIKLANKRKGEKRSLLLLTSPWKGKGGRTEGKGTISPFRLPKARPVYLR